MNSLLKPEPPDKFAAEAEKAPQGLNPVPEGTSQFQPGISNPWQLGPASAKATE
jgi:hypothetical protein